MLMKKVWVSVKDGLSSSATWRGREGRPGE